MISNTVVANFSNYIKQLLAIKKYIERLRRIDYLIRTKSAGDIKCLAKKLNLSRSSVLYDLKEMKELGFPIGYCRKRRSYYYKQEGRMIKELFDKLLTSD